MFCQLDQIYNIDCKVTHILAVKQNQSLILLLKCDKCLHKHCQNVTQLAKANNKQHFFITENNYLKVVMIYLMRNITHF